MDEADQSTTGPGISEEFILCMRFGKICFSGNCFREVCVSFCCCHRRISPAPFCPFKSFLNSSPVITFLNHSENWNPSLGLWQPAWIDYYSISWGAGGPSENWTFLKNSKTVLWKFLPLDDSVWAELRTYCQSSRNIGDRVCGLFFFFFPDL